MKKVANIILALIVVLLFTNSASFAVEPQIDLYINDVNVKPDSSPYISDTNRTMVPISFVANGFNFDVKWNAGAREVVINNNGKEAKLYIDSKYALVNGVKTEIDPGKSTSVTIKNGRTMVPVSFVANEFKFGVVWNAKNREVVITKDNKEVKLYIDSKYAYVDGVRVEIDPGKSTAVVIKNGRTMVPVAFVAKTFDVEVGWVAYPRGGGIVKFYSKDYVKPTTPVDVTTPTGKLSDVQSKYVVDKMNASVAGSCFRFEDGVAKFSDKQREYFVQDFIKDMKPPTGIQWLVSTKTVHDPGIPCIAGLEIKTENGIKYQRVFNIPVNYDDNDKLYNTADFEYRTNWERVN